MEGRIGKLEGEMAGVARFQGIYVPLAAFTLAAIVGSASLIIGLMIPRFNAIEHGVERVDTKLERTESKLDRNIDELKKDVGELKGDMREINRKLDALIAAKPAAP